MLLRNLHKNCYYEMHVSAMDIVITLFSSMDIIGYEMIVKATAI